MGKRLAAIEVSVDDLAKHINARPYEDSMAFPPDAEFRYCYMDDASRSVVFVFEHPDFYEMHDGESTFRWLGDVR